MRDEGAFGQDDVKRTWWRFAGEKPGVIFTVWDPGRCSGIWQEAQALKVRMWGYFAIDGVNDLGTFGGPAAEVVRGFDRVIAYGHWGAKTLSQVKGDGRAVSYLPHGLDLGIWQPNPLEEEMIGREWVGCVAANQPRKDLGLLFEAWREMKAERPDLRFWLHTDEEVRHWSVPELAKIYGLDGKDLLVTTEMTDGDLAEMYRACLVTMLPTLGEGFGYPIVESLACGTPCVTTDDHAGGRELVPKRAWRVQSSGWRTEGLYGIRRPVGNARAFARKALWAIEEVEKNEVMVREYCSGAVAHLGWEALAGRWVSWIRRGLEEIRGER